MKTTSTAPAAALAALLMLAACGGGGGSPPATPDMPEPGTGGSTPGTGDPDPDPSNGAGMPNPGTGSGSEPAPPAIETGSAATTGHRDNANGADLAWHWHELVGQDAIESALALTPAPAGAAARLGAIARAAGEAAPAGVEVLGAAGGFTVGRWTAGPADHMPVTVDFRFYPDIPARGRAPIERAAKFWSHHLSEPLTAFTVPTGPIFPRVLDRWLVDEAFVTHGTVVFVTPLSLLTTDDGTMVAGTGNALLTQLTETSMHTRTGDIAVRDSYLEAGGGGHIATHEIGHALTVPYPEAAHPGRSPAHDRYTDEANGTWTGPAATAVHDGPVPFRPFEDRVEYAHWADEACPTVLAYGCGHSQRLTGPSALDVAYLKDLGYPVADAATADATEMYSYGAWAEDSAIAITVTRDLKTYMSDRIAASARAFGVAPGTDFATAHAGMTGNASWNGILLGADLGTEGLPPVAGDAAITVDLGELDGTARFANLQVLARGEAAPFRAPTLEYDFTVTANTFADASGRLHGAWYGSAHEEVAGTVADYRASVNLLGAFIASE